MGWAWAKNVGRTGEHTGIKYCVQAECEHCVGAKTRVGVKVFLIVNLNPPKHRLHWSTYALETYLTPKIQSPHLPHGTQVETTPVWSRVLFSHHFPPGG